MNKHIKLFEQYTNIVSETVDLYDFEKELNSLDKDEIKYYVGHIKRREGVHAYSLVHDSEFKGFPDKESVLNYIKTLIEKGIEKYDIDILSIDEYKKIQKIREQGN